MSTLGGLPEDRYLNREVSWLRFNERVLDLALDPSTPLLERAKFLAIFASNLDEFYMVRVAGMKRRMATGLDTRSADGLTPREQLEQIAREAQPLVERAMRCFTDDVAPALAKLGIQVMRWQELDESRRVPLAKFFRERVFPVLTPLAVDPAHPFPYISGLSLNLAVLVRDPVSKAEHFARVKVPPLLPRFVSVGEDDFVPLEDLIAAHLDELFPGMEVIEHHAFRVTRNADLDIDEDDTEDLLQALERELMRRRFGPAVRLEVEDTIAPHVLDLLMRELEVEDRDVQRVSGVVDLTGLWAIYELHRPELKDPPFVPTTQPRLVEAEGTGALFRVLREGDVLVHHPYDSFTTSVQRFVEAAAADPQVLAIKQTLYRTSGDSPVVEALIDAAEAGKQVVCVVELKARFDEQANIKWARALERAGCHVVYGLVGLKTHCKVSLVVRQEKGGGLRRYAHLGTGNYNPKTARMYEDVGLLTADPEIGADLTDLFNVLTGYSRQTEYRSLLVAPNGLRTGVLRLIDREAEHAREGRPAGIRMKINSLVDEQVVDALYRASQAGVPIDLCVRGICALRPGVPGLSESIRVTSVLGRFLEHSRLLSLCNGGEPEAWFGSADLMHRNLDRRVEAMVRVRGPEAQRTLQQLLELYTSEDLQAWVLGPDGAWTRRRGDDGAALMDVQAHLSRGYAARSASS